MEFYNSERAHLCEDEGCENQPAPHTHPGLPPWKIVLD
jgi:hypothetical protein